ncbi:MAG: IS4 family transposase, partial [Egibacteraceae bacterium]
MPRDLVELARQMPQTRLIDVCDREADCFELFDEPRQNPRVELLVRAQHHRNLEEEPCKRFAAVRQAPIQSRIRVSVPRKKCPHPEKPTKGAPETARPPGRADGTRHARPTAAATRPRRPGAHRHPGGLPAREENPPAGAEPVEWLLLTTLHITSAADAEPCLRWYCLRWRIEDWQRVLKSGCRIEDLAHHSADRLR